MISRWFAACGVAATAALGLGRAALADVLNMGPGLTSIQFVTVGNPGNPADSVTTNLGHTNLGSVSYSYRVSTYEVTNAQYAEFLNAKAATDSLWPFLYDGNMASDPRGGIVRSGTAGNYTYTIKENMANKPANYVDVYGAMRFTNWLHNGQGSASTEMGVYALNGSSNFTGSRDPNATYFLPTQDEWHKAAYYQPAADGGDTDSYWKHPIQGNSNPTVATANATGDIANPGPAVANYSAGADWNSQNGNVTTVGTAGNTTYYGVYDMAGNVAEWTETLQGTANRIIRGGSYGDSHFITNSNYAQALGGGSNGSANGFRLAAPIPEPGSLVLVVGVGGIMPLRRRRA